MSDHGCDQTGNYVVDLAISRGCAAIGERAVRPNCLAPCSGGAGVKREKGEKWAGTRRCPGWRGAVLLLLHSRGGEVPTTARNICNAITARLLTCGIAVLAPARRQAQ